MAEALLITRDDIVKFTAMNGNVDTDKFIQFVKIAQDIHSPRRHSTISDADGGGGGVRQLGPPGLQRRIHEPRRTPDAPHVQCPGSPRYGSPLRLS